MVTTLQIGIDGLHQGVKGLVKVIFCLKSNPLMLT
jgi:hypothetical protein